MTRWEADAELELWDLVNAEVGGGASGDGAAATDGGDGGAAAGAAKPKPTCMMDVVAGWSARKQAAGEQFSDALMVTGVDAMTVGGWVAANVSSFRS